MSRPPQCRLRHRATRIVTAMLLAVMALGGCGGEGSSTQCSLAQCTVTLERTGDSTARILGVEVGLVGVSDGRATLDVAGQRLQLRADQQTRIAGFDVSLQQLTEQQAVVRISHHRG